MLSRFRHVPLVRINEVTRVSASTDLTRYVTYISLKNASRIQNRTYAIRNYIKENNDLSFYEKGVDVPTCPQNSHQKPRFWTMQNQTIGHCQKS